MDTELKRILEETYTASVEENNSYSQGAYDMATMMATRFLHISWDEIRELEHEQTLRMWANNVPSC